MKKLIYPVVLLMVCFSLFSISQHAPIITADDTETDTPPAQPPVQPPIQPSTTNTRTQSDSHVFIIIADSSPDQVIVLDANGKWLPDIKSVTFTVTIGEDPTCTCVMWSGFYRPTDPVEITWPLRQVRSVGLTEFKSMIDSLQNDPMALAND